MKKITHEQILFAACAHEIGHAVIYEACGKGVISIMVSPSPIPAVFSPSGEVIACARLNQRRRVHKQTEALSAMAGMVFQKYCLFSPNDDLIADGSGSDLETLSEWRTPDNKDFKDLIN